MKSCTFKVFPRSIQDFAEMIVTVMWDNSDQDKIKEVKIRHSRAKVQLAPTNKTAMGTASIFRHGMTVYRRQ